MKTTVFAIFALSVLVGVATPASAALFNAKAFLEQQERFSGGSD